jgi:AraC-like DNA-binding protein
MHTDRSQLFRRCKQQLGMSQSEYLRDIRLERAHALLERRAGNVSEIAYAVGFDSLWSGARAAERVPSRVALAPAPQSEYNGRREKG